MGAKREKKKKSIPVPKEKRKKPEAPPPLSETAKPESSGLSSFSSLAKEKKKEVLFLIIVLAGAIILHTALFLNFRKNNPYFSYLILDAKVYHEWALGILQGYPPSGAFHQAPLYPYFLAFIYAIFGENPSAVYMIQLGLNILNIFLIYLIGRHYFGRVSASASLLLALLWCPFAFYAMKLVGEIPAITLSLIFILTATFAMEKSNALLWLLSGSVLGISALARPTILLLLPFVLVWIFFLSPQEGKKKWGHGILFLLAAALFISPATLKNYRAEKDFILISANFGETFYQGNNKRAEGTYVPIPGISAEFEEQREDARRVAEQEAGRPLTSAEVSGHFLRKGLAYLGSNPGKAMVLEIKKLYSFFSGNDYTAIYSYFFERQHFSPVLYLFLIPFYVIALAFLIGLYFVLKQWRTSYLILAAILSYLAAPLLFFVIMRYKLPAVPFLILVGGVAFSRFREIPGSRASLVFAIAALAFVAGIFILDSFHPPPFSSHYNHLGRYYIEQGMAGEAEDVFRRALEENPSNAYAHNNLGLLLLGKGEMQESYQAFKKAIALNPVYVKAYNNLGQYYLKLENPQEALHYVENALRLKPDDTATLMNLGIISFTLGKNEEALAAFARAAELAPRDPKPLILAGSAYSSLEDLDNAILSVEQAFKIDPDNYDALTALGELNFKKGEQAANAGQLDTAKEYILRSAFCLEKALKVRDDDPALYPHLSFVYYTLSDYQKALETLEQGKKINARVDPEFEKHVRQLAESKAEAQ